MLLEQLREIVWKCNLELPRNDLVKMTSGNVSGRDAESGLVVIKPSGYAFEELTPAHMVVVDMDGKVVEGSFKPSTDTDTHLYVYKHRPDIFGMVHTLALCEQFCSIRSANSGLPDGFRHAWRRNSPWRVCANRRGGYWTGNYK
jgi:L-ribulose-5-phosphate 4-epimerase